MSGLDYRKRLVLNIVGMSPGPQGVGTRIAYNDIHLTAGMTVTNGKPVQRCIAGRTARKTR